jgi:hypothetical protein
MTWIIDRICKFCEHRDDPCDYCLIQAGLAHLIGKEDKE